MSDMMDNKEEIKEKEKIEEQEVQEEVTEVQSEKKEVKEKKGIFKKKEDSEKKKLEEENKLLNEKLLRISAEMQNMKRRNEDRIASLLKYEGEDLIKKLLPTIDNFERAIGGNTDTLSDEMKKYLEGFKMIYQNFKSIIDSLGVEEIICENKPFDPNTMEAVMVEEVEGIESDQVIAVLQKGYIYKDKVIRHAMVKVSK